ncbi:hypothetical protein Pelo_19348 [Pelomyxa schiedti]|nr:hypothetical protein Pelo_19348 [Pelomyxa schiedti]
MHPFTQSSPRHLHVHVQLRPRDRALDRGKGPVGREREGADWADDPLAAQMGQQRRGGRQRAGGAERAAAGREGPAGKREELIMGMGQRGGHRRGYGPAVVLDVVAGGDTTTGRTWIDTAPPVDVSLPL